MDEEAIAREIVDSAVKVHSALGPGLLEGAYEACLDYELRERGLAVRTQVAMPVQYGQVRLDIGYRLDMLVEEQVPIELKAIERMSPVHAAQLLSYLRLGHYHLGLLLNFHCVQMRDGIRHIVNGWL